MTRRNIPQSAMLSENKTTLKIIANNPIAKLNPAKNSVAISIKRGCIMGFKNVIISRTSFQHMEQEHLAL